MKKLYLVLLVAFLMSCNGLKKEPVTDYEFDGTITEEVLVNYLRRSVTFNGLAFSDCYEDDMRMVKNIGPKFVGRISYIWNDSTDFPDRSNQSIDPKEIFDRTRKTVDDLHAIDPDIIAQSCIFEVVDSAFVEKIMIPDRVFEAYGLEPEERTFIYHDMIYPDSTGIDLFGKNKSAPDISQQEARLWFMYMAMGFIDAGAEALHMGQFRLYDAKDDTHVLTYELFNKIRDYGRQHARRHIVLLDAHVPFQGMVSGDGYLLFDFHSFPQRMVEDCEGPVEGYEGPLGEQYYTHLEVGHKDALYKKSKGGITPSGWECESLPYIVEFDNSGHYRPGICGDDGKHPFRPYWPWGWDEVQWFYHSTPEYRSYWLDYAYNWVKETDPAGSLQMPLKIPLETRDENDKRMWYKANTPSEACPEGVNVEGIIKQVWEESI